MNKKYFAGIDIGSNAIRLLIKQVNFDFSVPELQKIQLVRVPLRLGADAFGEGKISKPMREKLVHLMKAYRELMNVFEVEAFRACATSAMREAYNSKKILTEVLRATGIKIEVISGEEEARLVSDSRFRAGQLHNRYVLFVDVGGGSTELNLFEEGRLLSSASFNIGTVRLLENKVLPDVLDEFDEALAEFRAKYSGFEVVGTGGNINKLVRLNEENPAHRGERFISCENLRNLYEDMKGMSIAERMKAYNLKPDRSDVIVPAAEIFLNVLDTLKAKGISVPTSGLADGIISDLLCRYLEKNWDRSPQTRTPSSHLLEQ